MPIEFHCTRCGRLLRVPDDAAGQQARCPECGAVMPVSADAPPGAIPPPVLPSGAERPAGAQWASGPEPTAGLGWAPLEIGDVLDRTWAIFKRHWAEVLLAEFLVWLTVMVAALGALAVRLLITPLPRELATLVAVGLRLAVLLVLVWVLAGFLRFVLCRAAGRPTSLAELYRGGPCVLPLLLASVLTALVVGIGFLFFLIPGVILGLMFSQAPLVIIDRGVPVLEAFEISRRIMVGNKLALFVLNLAVGIVATIVCGLTAGLGALAILPFLALLHPVCYLVMTTQPTADRLGGTQ